MFPNKNGPGSQRRENIRDISLKVSNNTISISKTSNIENLKMFTTRMLNLRSLIESKL